MPSETPSGNDTETSSEDKTDDSVPVELPDELVEQVDDRFDERGFDSREAFIESAVRDAVHADDPYTEQARAEIDAVREAYEEGDGEPIEETLGE